MKKIWKYIKQLNLIKTISYSKKVKQKVLIYRKAHLNIDKSAEIMSNAAFILGKPDIDETLIETVFYMGEKSKFINKKGFTFFAGTKVKIYKKGILEVEGGYLNSFSRIHCSEYIHLGEGVIIGENVVIRDCDMHCINGKREEISKPIYIGDHVWIGQDSIILKGVKIGNGSVVGAGSIVTKDVPENTIVCGVPAKVVKENIRWE